MPAHGVDAGRAGAEVALADAVKGTDCLLLYRLDRDRVERLVARCLEQRGHIGSIGLVAVAVAGDVRRMEQRNVVADPTELPAPVVG
jgi:hypothetical protein